MNTSIRLLRSILDYAKFYNCEDDLVFEHIDCLRYSSNVVPVDSFNNVLYCATRSETQDDFSWYGQYFDRHSKVCDLILNKPSWVFLIEDPIILERYPKASAILVKSVYEALFALYRYTLSTVSPCVCGVTGSVGKTTTVGLIEDIFKGLGKKVLRIYSKRITPLCLFDFIINHLKIDHSFVVMEYSLYQDWHIKVLADLLPPRFSGILNIVNSHIGVGNISSRKDIFKSKSAMLRASEKAFAPVELENICLSNGVPVIIFDISNLYSDKRLNPFVKTRLWYLQTMLATSLVYECIPDCEELKVIDLVNNYLPKEHRLIKIGEDRDSIFFDGDATNASRLTQLSDNFYSSSVLIICDVDFGDEPLYPQADILTEALSRFEYVYISFDIVIKYFSFIKDCVKDVGKIIRFDPKITHVIVNYLKNKNSTIFIHYGSYWRKKIGSEYDLNKLLLG